MANMSYCRFENTYFDLRDCFDALNRTNIIELSDSEREYAIKLIKMCHFLSRDFLEEVEYQEEINKIK